jgi:hypothetical protein
MAIVIYITVVLSLIFLGWPLFFYRRFSGDGCARPLGRAILWSAGFYFASIGIADVASSLRAHGQEVVAAFLGWFWLLLVLAPLPFNLFVLARGLTAAKK